MAAFSFLAAKRLNRENHRAVSNQLLAQSEPKQIGKQLEEWEKDT